MAITKKVNKPKVSDSKEFKTKKFANFYLRVLSRHPSTSGIRNSILVPKVKAVYRHGSTTDGGFEYEINTVDSVKVSSDKLKMKQSFDRAEVSHAKWIFLEDFKQNKAAFDKFIKSIEFSKDKESWIIAKHRMGSRGTGEHFII